jgi:uncharacterized membrane protein YbhN (UPF0104 family)
MAEDATLGEPSGQQDRRTKRRATITRVAGVALPLVIIASIFFGVLPQFLDLESLAAAFARLTILEWVVLVGIALLRMPLVGWQHRVALPGLSRKRGTNAYFASASVSNTIPGPSGMAIRYGMYRT